MQIESLEKLHGKIWFDGSLIDWQAAHAHVLSHSLHYGAAVIEGVRAYATTQGPAIFRLPDHTKRLVNSAKILGMPLSYSAEELNQAQQETIRANQLEQAYIRPIVFFGGETLGVRSVNKPLSVHVVITAWPWEDYLGADAEEKGVRVCISSYTRPHPRSNLYKAKATGNYINSILATNEAHINGYDEALLLDHQGHIAEGSGQNFFLVRNKVLYTPDLSAVLEGVTRDSVITLAKQSGLTVKEARLTRDDAYIADECFFTGTATEVVPIREIDGRSIGNGQPGIITQQLMQQYRAVVKGELSDYQHWLTPITSPAHKITA